MLKQHKIKISLKSSFFIIIKEQWWITKLIVEDLWVKMLITSILQTLKDNSEHERKCSVTKQLIITCSGCLNTLRSLICPQIPRLTHFDTLTPVQTLIMAKSQTAATFSDVIFTLKVQNYRLAVILSGLRDIMLWLKPGVMRFSHQYQSLVVFEGPVSELMSASVCWCVKAHLSQSAMTASVKRLERIH